MLLFAALIALGQGTVTVALRDAFDGEVADESDFLVHVDDLRRGHR